LDRADGVPVAGEGAGVVAGGGANAGGADDGIGVCGEDGGTEARRIAEVSPTGSIPRSRSRLVARSDLARPSTRWPLFTRASATALPMYPVAPVTRTFTVEYG
jgi:hypothetical protein